MEFSALPWTPFEVENATHPTELPPIQHTVLRPALMRRGVGGDDSWGAETHPEYRLPRGQDLVFRFVSRECARPRSMGAPTLEEGARTLAQGLSVRTTSPGG